MPAATIPVGFVDKFSGDLILLSQQGDTRLWGKCRRDPDMLEGRFGYFDRIGAINMQKRTSRHQDTQPVEAPWSRRRVGLSDYELPQLLDRQDIKRLGSKPTQGKLMKNALMAVNRQKDDIVIAAGLGTSYAIDEDMASTPIALPNSQIILNGGTGFTMPKLLTAREMKEAVEVADDEEWYISLGSHEVTNLLNTTEIKSRDYNTVQALAEGKLNKFMGFTFERTERLPKTGNIRSCMAFSGNGIGLAVGEELYVDIGPRRDKGNAQQLLVTIMADATRVEDEKVIKIDCDETA
jgi:hypothetical protein